MHPVCVHRFVTVRHFFLQKIHEERVVRVRTYHENGINTIHWAFPVPDAALAVKKASAAGAIGVERTMLFACAAFIWLTV